MSKSSTSVTMKAMKLEDKVKATNLCDGGKSCRSVAKEMGDGHTQSDNEHSQNKREILDDFENKVPSSRKHQRRVTGNDNINTLCWDWFQDFVD